MPQKSISSVERIISSLAGRQVAVGEVVSVPVDRIMAHDGSGPVVARSLERYNITDLKGTSQCVFVFDHYYPPTTLQEASLQTVARSFAKKYGIPLYAGQGISHQILPELGLLSPGTVFVGADSHTCTAGAFGLFALGLGASDVAGVLATRELWLEVPSTLFIRLDGRLEDTVTAQDLILEIMRVVGTDGALGKVIEFTGTGLYSLDMSSRMKLTNHAVEMGALTAICSADQVCLDWLKARGAQVDDALPFVSDYDDVDFVINLKKIKPCVACPSKPDIVVPLAGPEVPGVHVDQVFIGSCAGGRLEDLHLAANVLKGSNVHPDVRLYVSPSSQEVLRGATVDGTLDVLLEAGAVLLPPGCACCLGCLAPLEAGSVAVSTQNRNFAGRAGDPSSKLFLASPKTAAETALTATIRVGESEICR